MYVYIYIYIGIEFRVYIYNYIMRHNGIYKGISWDRIDGIRANE